MTNCYNTLISLGKHVKPSLSKSILRLPLMLTVAILLSGLCAYATPSERSTAFPYPAAPDSLATLQKRADYFVNHFWDKADFKRVFSNKQAVKAALNDYFAMTPHASADVTMASIQSLLSKLQSQPADLVFIANSAKEMLYGDSASFWSDELFLPFAQAVANNKKASEADRLRMKEIASILSTNKRGDKAPNPDMTLSTGKLSKVYQTGDSAVYRILFFNDPTCDACDLARISLDADYLVSRLLKAGTIDIVSIYPGEKDDESFKAMLKRIPKEWKAGALPDADLVYDLRIQPCFYILDNNGYIIEKNIGIDDTKNIIYKLRRLKVASATESTDTTSPITSKESK